MFTQVITLGYRCPNCNSSEILKKHIRNPATITNATNYALADTGDERLICFNCVSKMSMQLVQIRCELIESYDDFGVPLTNDIAKEYPFWECENDESHIGPDRPLYPIPLKRAFNGVAAPGGVYKKVAEGGYPWRCPTCKGLLHLKF